MDDISIHRVTTLDLKLVPWTWPFAVKNSEAAVENFAAQQAKKPALFNGRVLLMREPRVIGERLTATYFESDFATYLTWRDFGFPGEGIFSGFGMGALRDAGGVYVMGEMSPHTANSGRVYFPSGTPDPSDLVGDRVDIEGSIVREVEEETGLTPADYTARPGFHCVIAKPAVAIVQLLELKTSAAAAKLAILDNIARQELPEFSDVHLIRDAADITPAMPRYVAAFMRAMAGGSLT
jgi:8-oxo-dGTP pyrophosphatase MutT (NUDIX family)